MLQVPAILTNPQVRKDVGILDSNPVFPNTEQSKFHVVGWNTIRNICEDTRTTDSLKAETQNLNYLRSARSA